MSQSETIINEERQYSSLNYEPYHVVLTRGQGATVWDIDGREYLDFMSAYSAVSHGHCHPRIVAAIETQCRELGVVSRAYYSDKLGAFLAKACKLLRFDRALPMNTGAEAVETALKVARKWAYTIKGVPHDQAEIIACKGNFHGRTIAIVGLSSEEQYRSNFGPFPLGNRLIPYNDVDALEAAITPNTAAFLVEPIQGEGGIHVPTRGYLRACAELCQKHRVLLIADEVQTGLGRTGEWLASWHDEVQPDIATLGKALGGGFYPVSLVLASNDIMNVLKPGDHGSTFGGNPLASAIGLAALQVLDDEGLVQRAKTLGTTLMTLLKQLSSPLIRDVRGLGLLAGIEFVPEMPAKRVCAALIARGVLSKDTHQTVLRIAPPLVVSEKQLEWGLAQIQAVCDELRPA